MNDPRIKATPAIDYLLDVESELRTAARHELEYLVSTAKAALRDSVRLDWLDGAIRSDKYDDRDDWSWDEDGQVWIVNRSTFTTLRAAIDAAMSSTEPKGEVTP